MLPLKAFSLQSCSVQLKWTLVQLAWAGEHAKIAPVDQNTQLRSELWCGSFVV